MRAEKSGMIDRRVVLYLVEGKSDKITLEYRISELYDEIDEDYQVFFLTIPSGGDITAMLNVTTDNVQQEIASKFIAPFFDKYGFRARDIKEIVQITDRDGTYIPRGNVLPYGEDERRTHITYDKGNIYAVDVDAILGRNSHKSRILDYLISLDSLIVDGISIPYSIYYFSVNIDDYIHSNANLSSNNKVRLAQSFSRKCMTNIDAFVKLFTNDPATCAGMDYARSWDYIREGTRSLKRHTNLNLKIEDVMEVSMMDDIII